MVDRRCGRRRVGRILAALLAPWICWSAAAAIQFDIFLGYGGQPTGTDGVMREAGWSSLGCEVLNDGPSFQGVIELSSSEGEGQVRQFAVELPTNTRKRFVLPVFGSGGNSSWRARLLDERGRVRAELSSLRTRVAARETLLLGAIPRTFSGMPKLPALSEANKDTPMQPAVARVPVELVPDNPIALEGLDALYLNSEKALEFKEPQGEALAAWVRGGGHLIVAVEQPADINATPWLQALMPCAVRDVVAVALQDEMYAWLRRGAVAQNESAAPSPESPSPLPVASGFLRVQAYDFDRVPEGNPDRDPYALLAPDSGLAGVEFPVAVAAGRTGTTELAAGTRPLILTSVLGRGRVTALLFSPEREPFRSWKHREWFWARLLRLPAAWFAPKNINIWGGTSIDGVFGAMIDSRQVRKLPVGWLLLLLIVYLVVIGPLDQYVLKRINRQMLTWITFPCYVVLFSLLIYYIGYRLRAGVTEWNELQVVDCVSQGPVVGLRGRTYASIYSPVNARYRLACDRASATLRGEFLSGYGMSRESSRAEIRQRAQGFDSEVFVPVWTSQLYVCDWWDNAEPPLEVTTAPLGDGYSFQVRNRLNVPVAEARLVFRGKVYALPAIAPGGSATVTAPAETAPDLRSLVQEQAAGLVERVHGRQQAFGSSGDYWISLSLQRLLAISFLDQARNLLANDRWFLAPEGLDLSSCSDRGEAVLLAWVPRHVAAPTLRQFPSGRVAENTLYRFVLPVAPNRS